MVLDPFGGVALGGLEAMRRGLHWVGIELEARFCVLAQQNIDLWNKRYSEQMPNWGTAVIAQGDSRRLGEVLERANLCLSSPPFGEADKRSRYSAQGGYISDCLTRSYTEKMHSTDPQNLGNLPDTGFEAACLPGHRQALSLPVHTVAPEKPQNAGGSPQATLSQLEEAPSEAQEGVGQPVLAVSSPDKRGGLYRDPKRRNDKTLTATYSQDEAQLAQMPEGDLVAVISSPPFIGSIHDGGHGIDAEKLTGNKAGPSSQALIMDGYGTADGQLAALPEGDHAEACERPTIAISSPPWESSLESKDVEFQASARPGRTIQSADYGSEEGQLGAMPTGSHAEALEAGAETGRAQACISSPPWEVTNACEDPNYHEDRMVPGGPLHGDYGSTAGQLGQETGTTFWAASRTILEQVYQVLAPGGHAIFVCKKFVRNKKIVDFPLQWARLCEAVGFTWIHHHKAWLVEDRGAQHTLEGGLEKRVVKRFSFFRRLHSQKYPELTIEFEDVLCFVKE